MTFHRLSFDAAIKSRKDIKINFSFFLLLAFLTLLFSRMIFTEIIKSDDAAAWGAQPGFMD